MQPRTYLSLKGFTNIRIKINGILAYPQKFVHKIFNLRQISGNPQNFISLKICRPMVCTNFIQKGTSLL